jgi:hypothetical protein
MFARKVPVMSTLALAGILLTGAAVAGCGSTTPATSAGWYQAGHSWGAAERATGDISELVGFTEADYCAAVLGQASLIPGNPLPNIDWSVPGATMPIPSPVPQADSDALSWINGCAAGNTLPAPGASSAAPAPDNASAPDTSAPVAAPSQSSADPAAEQQAQTDLSTVQGILFSSDLAALHRDVQVTANDTAALKTAVAAGPGVSGECFSASAINAAASKIFNSFGPSDQVSLGSDATTLQQDISTARSAISALQDDVSTLQSTGSPVPSGTQAAITSAQNAISQAVTTGNADLDQANALANQAVTDISSLDTPTDLCANAVDRYEQGSGIAHVS